MKGKGFVLNVPGHAVQSKAGVWLGCCECLRPLGIMALFSWSMYVNHS